MMHPLKHFFSGMSRQVRLLLLLLSVLSLCLLLGCKRQTGNKASVPGDHAEEVTVLPVAPSNENPSPAEPEPVPPSQGEAGETVPVPAEVTVTPMDSGAIWSDEAGAPLVISGGCVRITVSNGGYDRAVTMEGDGILQLVLQNGAAYAGVLTGTTLQNAAVSLDATSTWSLQEDLTVAAVVNADSSFSNLHSGGYSLTYDSENALNAYLGGEAKALPDGGFLTPVI